jgi:hypothetical protein
MTATAEAIRSPDELEAELSRWRRERETAETRRQNAARYARDPLLWIDDNVWFASAFDTEAVEQETLRPVKAMLYPGQREFLGAWIDLERLAATGELSFGNVLDEKSRQIGCTWALAAAIRWLLAYSQASGAYIHESQTEVVDGGWTVDSFFGRVKFIDEHLDEIALPPGAEVTYKPPSAGRAYLLSPTGARVRGEVRRDNPGRGTTLDFVIVDEAAHVTHGELVHASLDDACRRGKLYTSTVNGDENFHARLCDARPAGWTYLRQHWSEHPVYGEGTHIAGTQPETCEACQATEAGEPWSHSAPVPHRYPGRLCSPWYDRAVVGKTDEQVASELDIDRGGALTGRVYPEFENAVHVVAEGIEIDPGIPFELAMDFGLDVSPCLVIQNGPYSVDVVGFLEAGDVVGTSGVPAEFAPDIRAYLASLGLEGADVDDSLTLGLRAIGDPSEQYRGERGAPKVAEWRRVGFTIEAPPAHLTKLVDIGIGAVKLLLGGKPKPLRVCGVRASAFATHMRNNVWPTDAVGNRRIGARVPLDNVHNHACTALRYWLLATYPPAGRGKGRVSSPARSRRRIPKASLQAR